MGQTPTDAEAEVSARIQRELKEAIAKHGEARPVAHYPQQVAEELANTREGLYRGVAS